MHRPDCEAVTERKGFILNLWAATKYHRYSDDELNKSAGTEASLEEAWSVLTGCYNEYHDDGDQMMEACTCDHRGEDD